jgi:hypothetical protein
VKVDVLNVLKDKLKYLKNMGREIIVFLAVTLVCAIGIAVFMTFYFKAYGQPYLQGKITDLSNGWTYETERTGKTEFSLRNGPNLQGGEKMTMYRTLDVEHNQAAILIRANHQSVNVYINDTPLYTDRELTPGENPGMALHFLLLPDDYPGKTLKIELASPYDLYSGRTAPILMGTIPSLEAYTLAQSMRSVIMMAMCILLGISSL